MYWIAQNQKYVVGSVRCIVLACKLILGLLQLVEKLLIAAVADADVTVRHSIFSSLHWNRGFDDFLAQADSLSAIFAALNDEVWFQLVLNLCILSDI